jgi:hypothetical protein
MLTASLRQLVDSPKRMWIVITLTFIFALVVTWPMADKYSAAKEQRADLNTSLSETRQLAARLSQFEETVSNQLNLVSVLDRQAMDQEKVQLFRSHVVNLVRQSGCKTRRIQLSEPQTREWFEGDSAIPGKGQLKSGAESTQFKLRKWQFTVTVAGPMDGVTKLLENLSKEQRLMHASRFSLQRADGDDDGAVLELELDFFELVKIVAEETA